ncbi:MAG: exonuclease SbcCD subunit D [Acetobacter sp.]|nr:exonuclease SbcCD subunit D [Bacteroides sp.]MCM1340249.1 exonuclease SbcCD subunit D [Acetobacter sp.]MCM1432799.1 exonuclease SbcCD subunit D [Clostridiales bacterium]
MKIFHLADLHLGKKVNGFSMIEEQKYILIKILNAIDEHNPDGVVIAGDVYDKSVPSTEAVELFNDFICRLSERNIKTFIISGNHDSAQRLAFASDLINKAGIYFSPVYDGNCRANCLKDKYGVLNIYMLPFIKPANARAVFNNAKIDSYTDAVKAAVENMQINAEERNILVTHQFVAGASSCDSEEISVGGSDNVAVNVFDDFDYVALGHLHSPQSVGRDVVRYSGTPLKYSFSEVNHKKSITVVDFKEKRNVKISEIPLIPKRDLKEITGTYDELVSKKFYENLNTDDYYHITLTDEFDVYDAVDRLRCVYPNLMKLDYNNRRTNSNETVDGSKIKKSESEYFEELYAKQNGDEMSDEQRVFIENLIDELKKGEV